ncbi:ribonuclease H-like domain-containing protein [Aspergillus pseudoustus]|uniref:Ribonuclease H-like domain-containing protein n=1 Tax=Aspergillus pseudoustus TaxID=1810923 RepID=A0ABR4K0I0_9EURO
MANIWIPTMPILPIPGLHTNWPVPVIYSNAVTPAVPLAQVARPLEKATLREDATWQWVSTADDVRELINSLERLPNEGPPSIYIDLEGVNLGRDGTVSILQMYVLPYGRTYLVDVHTMKGEAFTTRGGGSGPGGNGCGDVLAGRAENGRTLKDILEDPNIKKVIFDVRHDSDALYAHFAVRLAGIEDLQLMELATRSFERTFLKGLSHCIQYDIPFQEWENGNRSLNDWIAVKAKGRALFSPEYGGSFEVFNLRPLSDDILRYCIEDVRLLPTLWKLYNSRLSPAWRGVVDAEVEYRICMSQSPDFKNSGEDMRRAPPGWDYLCVG